MSTESITVKIQLPESFDALNERYTKELAKILSKKIPNTSINNYIEMIETIYENEISFSKNNSIEGDKNEQGCDLYEEV